MGVFCRVSKGRLRLCEQKYPGRFVHDFARIINDSPPQDCLVYESTKGLSVVRSDLEKNRTREITVHKYLELNHSITESNLELAQVEFLNPIPLTLLYP